jgi:hypothetical protein
MIKLSALLLLLGVSSATHKWSSCLGTLGSEKDIDVDDEPKLLTLSSDYRPKEIEVCYD